MKFKPHGRANCRREDNFIFVELEGPWNAELMHQIQRDIDSLKADLPENVKWGLLVIVSNSVLCSFDTIAVIRNIVEQDFLNKGHAAVGFVVARSVEGRGLVENIFRKIYDGICPMDFFDSIDEGKYWVAKYLSNSTS